METQSIKSASLAFIFLAIFSSFGLAKAQRHEDFIQCLSCQNNSVISGVVYTPNNSTFLPLLRSATRNLRFTASFYPLPLVIVTPVDESEIQAVVLCAKQTGMQIRTRSGGHDYEGLSYTAQFPFVMVPFVVVDLVNMSSVSIDTQSRTAWIQAGAQLGQVYYSISQASRTLGFPGGVSPTVGSGGLFSGGGYGRLLRKYGLAADNIIDARIVDANGRILDRQSMGEDFFWAIRGGGAASFGVVTAWKVNLVTVPETNTIFAVTRTLEQNATELLHKWQSVAPNLPRDLVLIASVRRQNSTILIQFDSLFLGRVDGLLQILNQYFPELGVRREDCTEVSWIQSVLFFGGLSIDMDPRVLTSRVFQVIIYFKSRIDYVQKPIPIDGLKGMWDLLLDREIQTGQLFFVPYGGRMDDFPESAIPFPHRKGNLYHLQELVSWPQSDNENPERYLNWSRRLVRYMTRFVSKNPRRAYVNYRDLEIGVNNAGNTSYAQARIWGVRYFNRNFDRLVRVKTAVDPGNFFRNEQSIPSLAAKPTWN